MQCVEIHLCRLWTPFFQEDRRGKGERAREKEEGKGEKILCWLRNKSIKIKKKETFSMRCNRFGGKSWGELKEVVLVGGDENSVWLLTFLMGNPKGQILFSTPEFKWLTFFFSVLFFFLSSFFFFSWVTWILPFVYRTVFASWPQRAPDTPWISKVHTFQKKKKIK